MEDSGDYGQAFNRFIKNSFFLVASRVVDIGVIAVSIPLIARYLGLKAFGEYALVTAITIFFQPLAEFGAESVICRDLANKKYNAAEYINSAMAVRTLLSVLLILIYYSISKYLAADKLFAQAVLISVFTELLISFNSIFFSVIRAYERMDYELFINFLNKIVFLSATILVVYFNLGFLSLFYARFFSTVILLALSSFFVFKRFLVFKAGFNGRIAAYILKSGFPIAMVVLLATASSKVDVFFLKYFRGPVEIALFEAANRLIIQIQFIPLAVVTALFPFLTRLSAGDVSLFKISYERGLKILYIGSIFAVMFMVMGAETIIGSLFGEKFLPSVPAFRIVVFIFIFFSLNYFLHQILIIKGKQRVFTAFALVSFLLNVLLDFLLVPTYGYIGASVATLFSCLVLCLLSVLYASSQVGGMNFIGTFAKPTAAVLLTGAACYFIINKTIISLIVCSCLGLLIYIALLLMMKTFSGDELETFKDFMVKKLRFVSASNK